MWQLFTAYVTAKRTPTGSSVLIMAERNSEWSFSRWIGDISDFKSQKSGCMAVLKCRPVAIKVLRNAESIKDTDVSPDSAMLWCSSSKMRTKNSNTRRVSPLYGKEVCEIVGQGAA